MPIVILPNCVVGKSVTPSEILVHVTPSGDLQIPLSVLPGYCEIAAKNDASGCYLHI